MTVVFQATILFPSKDPATNCSTSINSPFSVQIPDNGGDVFSSIPQGDDPLSGILQQLSRYSDDSFQQALDPILEV